MATAAMRASPDLANGNHNPQMAKGARRASESRRHSTAVSSVASYEDEPGYASAAAEGSYPQSAPKASSVQRASGPPSRSFSARAAANLNYTTRKPAPAAPPGLDEESTTPRGLPPAEYLHGPNAGMPESEEAQTAPGLPSPPSRSNTMRSTSGASTKRDWASDRSPLQKLEVTLNGISKEEKRARVQEAEMRLRERLARQKIEKEQAEVAAAAASTASAPRPNSKQSPHSADRGTPASTRTTKQRDIMEETARAAPPMARQPGGPAVRHNRAVSMNPQYPAIRRAEDAQYPGAENARSQPVKMGNVPRRSVTVREHGAKEGPNEKLIHTRSVSQQGPPKTTQPVAAISSAERLETPPAAKSLSGASLPRSKPRQTVSFDVPPPTPPPIFEWKNAPVARLGAADFDFQHLDIDRSKAWWEGGASADRRKSRALPKNYQTAAQKVTGVTQHKNFQPKLFLRCGPLLRYTGIRTENIDGAHGPVEKEFWRGSIMIVTKDSRSSYEVPPTLRLFSQPMDLLPPPPAEVSGENGALAPEYVDPTAGLMKVGRDGRPLYVKPVDHLEEEVDLSAVENDDGIYELSPSMIDYSSEGSKQPIPSNRIHPVDGETAELHRDIPGVRLYADAARDVTFWRFSLEIELSATQQRIAYRINQGPALGFWVPAMGKPMNIMFHSGNGFGPNVDPNPMCGPDPLWRDILNEHQTQPFHVMIGGGDQIFNDSVITDLGLFQEWIKIKNAADRYGAPLTPEFRAELEKFYLERYASWFSQGLFSLANSQIPMVNIWNDHEIFEGFGSYNDEFMRSAVISGLGKIAFKYYLLFQHHSVPDETEMDEPSWLLGARPGPYIEQRSRNLFMSLGSDVVFLGLDCRTERQSTEVISSETSELIWDRCHREIVKGKTKHLIVLSSIPIAYPRVAMLKNYMNSRKSLGKAGMIGGLVNRSGGNVEVFDDHWAGKHLKAERTWLVEDLQDLAAEKSVRVTILSGDVHLAAIGQFYSNSKLDIAKDRDYRYMPNVISSAIANVPETEIISDMLNKRNTVHHMDSNTDEDVIPIFTQDVDGKPRNNKRLLPRRNWCSIREYRPGSTPPGTPESELTPTPEPRPGKLQRTLSLGRGDKGPGSKLGGLLRRLSTRGGPPTRTMSIGREGGARRASVDGPLSRPNESADSYFPQNTQEPPRPGQFHRRPTNLSLKAAKKAAKQGDDGAGALVDLEGGLAITLNLEISPHDPAGITVPYKLLIPVLRYEGTEYDPEPTPVVKGWRKWLRMPRRKKNEEDPHGAEYEDEEGDDYEDHDTINNTRANAAAATHPHYDGYPGSDEEEGGAVPHRVHPEAMADESFEDDDEEEYEDEEPSRPRKKWFGVL
ncbi:uncharacterized protein N7496_002542 [Penicillium cataractarum]|uniref:PhoD-like phosphatase domain-containing protein n=1 Tax=Penicillium cataractarum TaxID=2100454 RepID=A0A9W9SLZ9_9EURO|nr:uncharacterized protein N7496_002542 [Penicillium cataractarum]KAJ5380114.1 hypothetical protein N7496_002542 [Penicillium cataractarum]